MTYNKETLKEAIVQKLRLNYGCTEQQATDGEMMKACAMVLRDIMAEHGVQTRSTVALGEHKAIAVGLAGIGRVDVHFLKV